MPRQTHLLLFPICGGGRLAGSLERALVSLERALVSLKLTLLIEALLFEG